MIARVGDRPGFKRDGQTEAGFRRLAAGVNLIAGLYKLTTERPRAGAMG